jgi:hypothetical protein
VVLRAVGTLFEVEVLELELLLGVVVAPELVLLLLEL